MVVPNHLVGQRVGKNRIELVALIGEGAYGCVYRGIIHLGDLQKQCAVKCMARTNLDAYHLMVQRREILLHQQVSDGHGVVSLYETFEEDDYQFIVMEFCPDGDLWEGIAKGKYSERDDLIRDVFTQIIDSVEYCHSKRVFHRDLKPENILLADGGRKVLLADFGLASGSPISNEMRCGSPWYMSPECWGINYAERPYATAPNDVWSLGILLINLACGRHAPWKQATSRDLFFRDYVKQPGLLRFLLPMSSEAHDLLDRVFVLDPSARISLREFRIAIQQIDHFAIPAGKRAELRDVQRATWSAAIRPSPSHPLSIETLRLIPVTSYCVSSEDDGEGVDITDVANHFLPPWVLEPSHASGRSSDSFICDIPIIDTSPGALLAAKTYSSPSPPPSSASSAESGGPITPDMLPTVLDLEVPAIEASQDISDALNEFAHDQTGREKGELPIFVQPIQNILRAIGAL